MIISERLSEYIKALECDLPEYLDELEQRALADEVPIIRKEAQSLLRFLLCLLKPEKILEVGCAVGFSSAFMSEYMPENCTITTIEKVEMRIKEAKKNLARIPKADKVTLICGDALDVLKELSEQGETYPFIFMDGILPNDPAVRKTRHFTDAPSESIPSVRNVGCFTDKLP